MGPSSGSFFVPDVDLLLNTLSGPVSWFYPYLLHSLYIQYSPYILHPIQILAISKMPSTSNLVRFLALSVATLSAMATPSPTTTSLLPFNPLALAARAPVPEPYLATNAQRMARGLPPKKPRFNHARKLVARQSATPCVPSTGTIRVDLAGPPSTGYVSSALNAFGEFQFTQNPNEAVEVSICFSEGVLFDIRSTVSHIRRH